MCPLDDLNPSQREAVMHGHGPALVVAGAGSGKTRVLTRRLAYLIEERAVSPFSILAITFTNKAAREMKDRCADMIGEVVRQMWVGTFHSICVRILRRWAERVGYSRDFVIYDRGDQLSLLRRIMKELNIDEKQYKRNSVLHTIGRAKNAFRSPGAMEREDLDPYSREVARIYRQYQRQLADCNAMDFDDLLLVTVRLLEGHPDVAGEYRRRFSHILVDEYQDTNRVQYRLIRLLADGQHNVFAVGDSDQSIYGWRGADIGNILNFEADYPEAPIYKLERNYRSTQPILRAAGRVIRRNHQRQEKELWTDRSQGEPVCFYRAATGGDEAHFVVSYIEQMVNRSGRRWSDFAVLYRTNAQSRLLEEMCMRRRAPHKVLGATRYYDREEIRDAIALLRLLLNPGDWVSMRRVINKPRRGVGPTTVQRLEEYGETEGLDVFSVMDRIDAIDSIRPAQKRGVGEFAAALRDVRAEMTSLEPAEMLMRVLEETGCGRYHRRSDSISRGENLDELVGSARDFAQDLRDGRVPAHAGTDDTGPEALGAFLSEVALISDTDQYQEGVDSVTLMTLHSAKGLEFPVVFIVGMEEGLFPHARSLEDPEQLEEERRLCYVGMTRAEDQLILSAADMRSMFGEQPMPMQPSRFLHEIGEEYLCDVQSAEPEAPRSPRGNVAAGISGGSAGSAEAVGEDFSAGDKVHHRVWGEGTVVQRKAESGDVELTIAFAEEGIKRVVAGVAPLTRVSSADR